MHGDGLCELLLGYTDRVVRAFCWESPPDADLTCGQLVALKKWLLEGQVDSLSVNPAADGTLELMVSQPGCGYAVAAELQKQGERREGGKEAPNDV
eukprot:XP_017950336.1 PREDICTED: integrin-alpha FG-GAP repeat-containing protein 2-like [Xenopus tropicalis]